MALVRLIIHPNEAEEERYELAARCVTVGSADDNDVCLTQAGISPHHFKIEQRAETWYLVDLRSKQGTFVNEERITEIGLQRGTIFHAGDVCILFDVVEEIAEAEVVEADANLPTVSQARMDLAAPASTACWRCRQPLPPMTTFCPACGADQRAGLTPSTYVAPLETASAPGAGLMPLIALIVSILGPLLFGVGWLVGIILGLISISIIRRRGAHIVDARRAHRAVYIGFAWMVVTGSLAGWWLYSTTTARRIAHNERATIQVLRDIAVAETYIKLAIGVDNNGDMIGEYGSFADLLSNGYGRVPESLASTAELAGYRFSLPQADESEFVCLAEPIAPGFTGRRAFLTRGDGYVYTAEARAGAPPNPAKDFRRLDTRNIVDEQADIVVRDLHKAASEALRMGQYERAQRIVRAVRERFPTSRELTQLDAVEQRVNPFVVEIKSLELLTLASNAMVQGQVLREIELLQTLRDKYPTYKGINDVDARLRSLRDSYAQQLEQAAQQLLDKAIGHDLRLQFSEAESSYNTIMNQYPNTTAAAEAQRRVALLATRKSDRAAATLLQETLSLSLDKDYEAIAARVEQLQRAFAHAAAVSQATERLTQLQRQATARICVAQANAAVASNDIGRALVLFLEAAADDNASLIGSVTNYGRVLIVSVSNALIAADYEHALDYADRYQALRLDPTALPLGQIDTIRMRLAEQSMQRGDSTNALAYLSALATRVTNDPAFTLLAGKIYRASERPERAAELFLCVATQSTFAAEARPLLLETAAAAAAIEEERLYSAIAREREWCFATRSLNLLIPGVTNDTGTSIWQAVCIDLADQVDMAYDLLTYSGADADFFVEKQKATDELNASMRRLQGLLRDLIQTEREAVIAARKASQWWTICSEVVSNYADAALTDDARAQAAVVMRKQYCAAAVAELIERAAIADIGLKNSVLDEVKTLLVQLQNRRPLRNMLATMKKYIADQRPADAGRKALAAVAALAAVEIDPLRLGDAFAHLSH